jgi:hypothetical protein
MAIYSGFTHYSKYGDFPSIDVLFPLVGWLIEGVEETPLTTGKF